MPPTKKVVLPSQTVAGAQTLTGDGQVPFLIIIYVNLTEAGPIGSIGLAQQNIAGHGLALRIDSVQTEDILYKNRCLLP